MPVTITVDLHSHTLWSKDCVTEFQTILRLLDKRDISRIAITDHNTAEGALQLQRMAPDRVIVGEEVMTTKGELLAYYVRESVPRGLTPEETIRRLRDQGAAISVSHPFDRIRRGAWKQPDLEAITPLVDAVEVFNARCMYPEDNARALAYAQEHGILGTAGSDGHTGVEYGRAMLRMRPFDDAEGLVEALRDAEVVGRASPNYVHFGSMFARWLKKSGLRKRMWEGG